MAATLHLLCAGAAQALVQALQPAFERDRGTTLAARYGAVGALQEALRGGQACDVFVATEAMVLAMQDSGELRPGTSAALGRVATGVAVPAGQPWPGVDSVPALRASLFAASAIYVPDLHRSTAGRHFAAVLSGLGIREALADRLRAYPNGATAMRELALRAEPGALGCTQVTEIRGTDGVCLVGPLPAACALSTRYCAAVAGRSASPRSAQALVDLLCGPASQALRAQAGFETDPPGGPSGGTAPG